MKEKQQTFKMPNQANVGGEIGVRTDLDPLHPSATVDRYAGDSVDEHKELEKANEHFADEELSQQNNNL